MKRLLIGLLFATSSLAQTPVTVTGLITDAGNNVATSGYVEFDIIPTSSGLHYFIAGFGTITQKVQCGINGSGLVKSQANLANPCTVWGNDLINPANTQYKVIFAPNGNITNQVSGECITGTTYSLNSPVFCPIIQISPQQAIVRANPFQTNIIPSADNVFVVGSALSRYANGFFGNFTVSSSLITSNISFSTLTSQCAFPAQSGVIRLCSTDQINWRNFANLADVVLNKNTSDALTYAGNPIVDASGLLKIGAFNFGTGASSSTFWRGDNTWAAPLAVAASVNLTAQGANIGGTTLITPGSNGMYRISCYVVVTRAATTSSTMPSCLLFSYSDGDTAVTLTNFALTNISTCNLAGCGPPSSSGTPVAPGSYTFFAGPQPIQYATANYASTGGTSMQYAIHVRLEGPF